MALLRGEDVTRIDGYEGRFMEDVTQRQEEREAASPTLFNDPALAAAARARAARLGRDGTALFVPEVRAEDRRERNAHGRLEAGIIRAHQWRGFLDDTVRARRVGAPRKPSKVQLEKMKREARRTLRSAQAAEAAARILAGEEPTEEEGRPAKRARREEGTVPAPRDMLTRSRAPIVLPLVRAGASGAAGPGYLPSLSVSRSEEKDEEVMEEGLGPASRNPRR